MQCVPTMTTNRGGEKERGRMRNGMKKHKRRKNESEWKVTEDK